MSNQNTQSNNKRLAKNTFLLYIRMILLMVVTLYTSRVTLQVLGVNDFGVYNIVGGVVVLFSFLANSLNTACNRFFSVAVAKNEELEIQKTFSTSLVAHGLLTMLVVFLLETLGFWLVVNKLNIPEGRQLVAQIIYHIAVLTVCLNILRTPFNASIIANEKMDFYAYSSIVEGLLKLVIVWILLIIPFDKLISYSILVMITILIINLWYVIYCNRKLKGNKIIFSADMKYMKEMLSFSGWNLFGGAADVGWQQGTNIILNMFYGVALNATMGITNQIRSAVYSFVTNLQTAANPQIIKSYTNKDFEHFHQLIFSISKYSFYLMLLFAIPLIVNIDFILKLWLGTPPESSSTFAILILIFSTIGALGGPLWVCIQATGDVKVYSVIVSFILLLNLPVTYVLFYFDFQPEAMLYARISISLLQTAWCILYARKKVKLSFRVYFFQIIIPISIVTILTFSSTYFIGTIVDNEWGKLLITTLLNTLVLMSSIFTVGMNSKEKAIVSEYVKRRILNKI